MKKEILYWISIIFAAFVYTAMIMGCMLAGLRSCVQGDPETVVVNTPFQAFEGAVVDSVSARVLEDVGIEPVVVEPPKLYTDHDAVVLAKTVWGEARGVKELEIPWTISSPGWKDLTITATCQQAAVVWTILNRYDAGYADTIAGVASAPNQFHGYKESYPVDEDILELVYDVLERWNAEKLGEEDVGRVLPAGYLWFGGDGKHNHFRNEYRGGHRWDWSLGDPYAI